MEVTLQYFDGCPNWNEADARLETLRSEGMDLVIRRQLIDSPEAAEAHRFRGSPTILINGVDPFADADAPFGLSCRVYVTEAGPAPSPSVGQLRDALQRAG